MARNVTVYFADGSRHEYQGVPDDATPEQVAARAGRDFQGKQIRHIERAPITEPERTIGGYAKEAVKGLIPGLVGLGETAITGAASLLPEEAEQAVRRPVEEFAAGVRETFAPAPGYEDTAVRKLSEAVGSTAPFLAFAPFGLAGAVAGAGLGVATGAGEARERAEEAGATEGERGVATALGTIPGALEALPPIRILRRFGFGDEAIKEVAGVAPALGRIARAGGEEALQEASSQVLQNLIAKGVYAPDEAVFGGVGEAATVGGGAGAVVSAIAELALGRRLRGPEAKETAPTEEPPPELTPEQLAPKPGRAAQPSPVRAKTLDELRGQMPPAPVAPEKVRKEAAPPREPMVFERTKEPTPEALQEAAEFVTRFPEGSKNFDLFKAKSIAKKLGYEGIPKKGVFRIDIEPLLRQAVAPRETITPAEDTVVGQNAAGEQLYERQDGSRYRMRFDRADRPAGYPDFGGDLSPIEAAPKITPPPVDALAGKEVRPPSDDVYEVAESNFNYPRMVGNQTLPIDQIQGGVALDQASEVKRVDSLANQIASDEGYISRIIVDQDNNVVEGQHRLEALRKLGVKEVPVYKIEDMGETFPVMKMEAAVQKAQPMRDEQASQIVKRALDTIAETGSVQRAYELEIPGFQKGYLAALNVIEPKQVKTTALPVAPVEPVKPAKVQKAVDQGIVGERSPEAIASLRAAAENPDTPVLESSGYKPPAWDELPNGFGARQYVLEGKYGRSVVQEIRAPKVAGKEPAVIRRGIDYDGTPFGEKEATGTLDEIYSGVAFSDFNDYFAAKNRTAIAPPTTPPEAPRGTAPKPVAEEAVAEPVGRGAELSVPRPAPKGRAVAEPRGAGLGVPSEAAVRADERAAGVEPALEAEDELPPASNLISRLKKAGFEPVDPDSPDAYSRAGTTYYTMRRGPVRLALDAGRVLDVRRGELFSSRDPSGKSVVLGGLLVDPEARRKGSATQAMQELADIADQVGTNLALEPSPIKGGEMSAKQLENFYSKFGFKPVGKLPKYPLMQRTPGKKPAALKSKATPPVTRKTPAPSIQYSLYDSYTFNFDGLDFRIDGESGPMSRPMLSVFDGSNFVGSYYANNEKKQVSAKAGDVGEIDKYNLPPSVGVAVKKFLSTVNKKAVDAAGTNVVNAVNNELQNYETLFAASSRPPELESRRRTHKHVFESIDVLNRTAPDLAEQTRDRAPSLRVGLKKAKRDYDAGVLTGDQLAETTGNLLLKTQKERIVRPRARGADYIRERLMNARRTGAISQEGIDLADWFIRQNPLLVDDLGISIRQQPQAMEGTAGFYNPVGRIVTLFKSAGDSQTATHEILHHLERLMPSNIRSGILKAYVKQLTKAAKNAKTDAEKAFFNAVTNYHYLSGEANQKAEYKKALDAVQNGQVPKSFYQYVNPSEFWAVNGARIVQGRYGIPPGIVGQIKRWLRDFIEKAKDVFGLKSDAAIIRALDSLAKADGKYQTDRMLAEAPGYRAVEPTEGAKPKKAKPAKPKKTLVELRREASAKMTQPGIVRQVIDKLTGPSTNYETLVKNFQDVNRRVKKLQNDLKMAGRLVTVGDKKTNIHDQISAAANRAAYIVATEVEPVAKRLRESLANYARITKGTVKDALEKIDSYRIALHEQERRETKYLRNVPLNNTTKEEFLPGEPAMTAADARAELEKRRSLTKDKAQAEALQDMIRYLAANYADPRGYSPVKAALEKSGKPTPEEMTTDFYDDIYNVIGAEYTQEEMEAARQEYEALDPETKSAVDTVFTDLNALHELNKDLNRRANYWTDKVDRVVESYGWKHYVPFKGNPRADKTFDTDTEYLSGELSEAPESFEGRRTNFDSPILQSIAESYFAASRAGRGTDVTTTIKNLINLGVIDSKRMKKFSFEERNSPDFDYNEVRGRDKVLHYNEDGSVEVYSIKDPEMLEAIKTPFREMNLATKIGNSITSGIGQLHTRFNVAFPPMDFIRNSITNAGLISAREGGKQAREYLSAVATNVARFGMGKSFKLSKYLAENRTAELAQLARKSPFYNDALEMMKYGGRTMYRMSFNISDTMEELKKQVGPKKILSEPSQFFKWVDAYNDAFELTSRVAAYTVRKQQNIAEAKAQGLNVNDPKVMEDINKEAAAFALSLMDFRKIGKYGKEMGAWFMFIRPAATGAVDAIDALRPGFFLKPEAAVEKGLARLDPNVQELFETKTLAEEIERIKGNKRPDKKKIAALEQEIVDRQKKFDEFQARQLTRAKTARNTALFTLAAGAALYGMAASMSGEDDEGRNRVETDDMSRWTRYLRLPIPGSKDFFQLPWGFGVSALMSAGAQTAAFARGASSFKDYAGNLVEIGIDSFLPIPASRINPIESFENFGAWLIDSATPSAARPMVEFVLNIDAMGNPIYDSRSGKYADAFSGSTRPSELHRDITQLVFNLTDGNVSVSPDSVAFALNNYADAFNHIAENSYNLALTAMGDKNFDPKKDTFFLRSFIGRRSNFDARQYAEAEKDIMKLAQKLKTFEDLGTPEQVAEFYRKNPNADILIDIYNKGKGRLDKLGKERKEILLDQSLTPKQREDYVENINIEQNYLKKLLVEDFKAYSGN